MNNITLLNCFSTGQQESGNPAAVVIQFNGDDSDKLALAKKINQPVTVFISDEKLTEPTLSFYYPETRMPLCLHGTLAAAKIILIDNMQKISCKTQEGKYLEINKTDDGSLQVKVTAQPFEKIDIQKDDIYRMLGLRDLNSIDSNLPLCIESVGSPKLLIPLISLTLLHELQPDYDLIKTWSIKNKINGLYVYTEETISNLSDFHARGFNPKTGHNEDAATGVAAAALSLALQKNITVEQGYALKKTCSIIVTYVNSNNILVGGKVSEKQQLA